MKKFLSVIMMFLLTSLMTIPLPAIAAGPGIIYKNDIYCGLWGGSCPTTYMMNRTGKKALARYSPNGHNGCNTAAMNVWIMGHPNNAYGVGFTSEDWQDLEVAKQKTGGWYRWGCCYSSDAYNTICLN